MVPDWRRLASEIIDGLPIEDPIVIFAIAMSVFLIAPIILERYNVSGIIGIILVGAAIGPNGINLIDRGETIVLLGHVGLLYLMFVAGLEIDFRQFMEKRDRSLVFGLLSFIIPQTIGTIVGVWVLDLTLAAALLFAAIFASHTLLAYPIINRLGIVTDEAVTVTIGGTILTDTLALLVLAVVIAAAVGELTSAFWLLLSIGIFLYFVAVWFFLPPIGRWFFRTFTEDSYFEFLFVMMAVFIVAALATVVGIEAIVGAFLAGLVFNQLIPETSPLMNRIEFVGNALLIPFFLLSVGMLVDVFVIFDGPRTVVLTLSFVGLVLVTKLAAAQVTGWHFGYSRSQIDAMFGLSLGQAAAALAIVLVAVDAGIPGFDRHMINATVLMILIISVISPWIVDRAGREIIRRQTFDDALIPETKQRILVPFSLASQYLEELLDLAILLREPTTQEPLRLVSVVPPNGDTDAKLAAAESILDGARSYAAGADVPADRQTRVNHNVASGIARAAVENRISTIVIGWDGAASRRQRMFGHVIDQVLLRTDQLVLVARAQLPFNATTRIVLFLPPGIEHNPGFPDALRHLTRLASHLGLTKTIVRLRFDEKSEIRNENIAGLSTFIDRRYVDDWSDFRTYLQNQTTSSDLIVCMSARRDTMGWDERLQTLPHEISTTVDGNFVVIYPALVRGTDERRFLKMT